MTKRLSFLGICAAAMLLMAPTKVKAQAGVYAVDYFVAATDQTYDFVNFTPATLSANIYVFSQEDPVACGACPVTGNGSIRVDLHANIIAAPVTGVKPAVGVIKIVYSSGGTPMGPLTLATGLKTFRTKNGSDVELNDDLPLSAAELARLTGDCSDIYTVLSGAFNVSCGPTD